MSLNSKELKKIFTAFVLVLILLLSSSFGIIPNLFGYSSESCQCVAFRIDDIKDNYIDKVQMEVMNVFQEKHIPLTIGIIANEFGNDSTLVAFIKDRIINRSSSNENGTLAIASHGWNHEAFTLFNNDEQSSLIKKANQKIADILGVTPSVFIPPYNLINNHTYIALQWNRMQYLSATSYYSATIDPPPYSMHNNNITLYRFPQTAETGFVNEDDSQRTLEDIMNSLHNYGFAVVTLHPALYSISQGFNSPQNQIKWQKIVELKLLIDKIQNEGLSIVPIEKIPNQFRTTTIKGAYTTTP
jgi:peptidoglycan/xylan/chitin deacetylase (PgdA/CDA1 family)